MFIQHMSALAGGTGEWIAKTRSACVAALLVCVGGCAAPGPPLPPTLNLPQMVRAGELTAVRVGGAVKVRWKTGKLTTDKLPVRGAIAAEVCREAAGGPGAAVGCEVVARVAAVPDEWTEAEDVLPKGLAEGPVRLLRYRVRLMNAAGRTAGLSPGVVAAAGTGAGEVKGFVGEATRAGVELRWERNAAGGVVELERTLLDPAVVAKDARRVGMPGEERQVVEVRLRAGDRDEGGVVDRAVEVGHSYRYTAQRVVESDGWRAGGGAAK